MHFASVYACDAMYTASNATATATVPNDSATAFKGDQLIRVTAFSDGSRWSSGQRRETDRLLHRPNIGRMYSASGRPCISFYRQHHR